MSTHIIIWGPYHYTLSADWSNATDSVRWCGERTQWNVEAFRGDWEIAAEHFLRRQARQHGLDPDGPCTRAEIRRAVQRAVCADPIEAAYRDSQGRWAGVDWTTDYGPWGWDLDGYSAQDLETLAKEFKATGEIPFEWGPSDNLGTLIDTEDETLRQIVLEELRDAADYLDSVASDAAAAEEAGAEAIAAVRKGDLDTALQHAEYACGIEGQYGDCPVWRGLRSAIEQAIEERDEAEV